MAQRTPPTMCFFNAFVTLLCLCFLLACQVLGSSFALNATDNRNSNLAETIQKVDRPRPKLVNRNIKCAIRRIGVLYENRGGSYWECTITNQHILDALGTKLNGFRILGHEVNYILSNGDHEGNAISSVILSSGVMLVPGIRALIIEPSHLLSINGVVNKHRRRSGWRNVAPTVGDLKTLVVRVTANDASPPSAAELASVFFDGTVSLKSQYARCSHNQLNIYASTHDLPDPLQYSATGVTEIKIDANANGANKTEFWIAANNILASNFGFSQHFQLRHIFDLILYVMPPGTGNWGGYARYIPSFVSFFNGVGIPKISTLIHEVGHNIGLDHSGLPTGRTHFQREYGDKLCNMGSRFLQDNSQDQRCFNAVKNWQLGWYDDKRLDMNVRLELQNGPKQFTLNGVVDYGHRSIGKYIVIKVGNYYIGFNRKADFNRGTLATAANTVTVHKKLGTPYQERDGKSLLLAMLNLTESFPITDHNVQVQYVERPNLEDAIVEFSLLEADNNPCNGELEVIVKTDNYPSDTSWSILNAAGETLFASEVYTQGLRRRTETVFGLCRDTQYTFTIFDTEGDGLCCSHGKGFFEGRSGGTTLFSGSEFSDRWDATFFIPALIVSLAPSPTATPPILQSTSESCSMDKQENYKATTKGRKIACKWMGKEKKRKRNRICTKSTASTEETETGVIAEICKGVTCTSYSCLRW